MRIYAATELLKAKYTRRWKGKDGKWHYEYTRRDMTNVDRTTQARIDLQSEHDRLLAITNTGKATDAQHLKYYKVRKQMVQEKMLSPSKVVGTGYKNPKKMALQWLDGQIEKYSNKTASK